MLKYVRSIDVMGDKVFILVVNKVLCINDGFFFEMICDFGFKGVWVYGIYVIED